MNSFRVLIAALSFTATVGLGCKSISDSLTSPSDSIAGSSRSIAGSFDAISESSGSGGTKTLTLNKESYVRDVREFTTAFTRTQGSSDDFLRGITRIAEDHGISDWEADASTPFAIGAGLRGARWSEAQMSEFLEQVGRDRPAAQLALDGYHSAGG